MGEHAKALGLGAQFEWQGQTWHLSPWSFGIQGQYEKYLEDQAIQAVRRQSRYLSAEEYQDLLQKTIQDIAAGVYSFGSKVVQESLKSLNNFQHIVLLCLKKNHPKVTKEEVQDIVKEMGEELMEKMTMANSDPTPDPLPTSEEEGQESQ